jgi:hypothetical protein
MSLESMISLHINDYEELGRDKVYKAGDKFIKNVSSNFFKPTISYNYLNINIVAKYCFHQNDFTESDYKIYFDKLKTISTIPLPDLENTKDKTLDFKIYTGNVKAELLDCFKKVVGRTDLNDDQIPYFGRIGLYNGRKKGDKAPRIFFFVGHYATIHILLYDPYHLIYPDEMTYVK